MNRYPVMAEYDSKMGFTCLGFAETEAEALAIISEGMDDSDAPKAARVVQRQITGLDSPEKLADIWADELEAGAVFLEPHGDNLACVCAETWEPTE